MRCASVASTQRLMTKPSRSCIGIDLSFSSSFIKLEFVALVALEGKSCCEHVVEIEHVRMAKNCNQSPIGDILNS